MTHEFEMAWRGHGLADRAKTIGKVIEALEAETQYLREMAEAGIVLAQPAEDDYVHLTTEDPAVAMRFGLERGSS